jgi:hypothetical protein
LFELRFEPREQRERVGGRPREARENAVVVQPADLARTLLDDGLPEGDLPVARQNGAIAVSDGQDRCAVEVQDFSSLSVAFSQCQEIGTP